MRTLLLIFTIILFFAAKGYSQDHEKVKKTTVFIHKQTGVMYTEYEKRMPALGSNVPIGKEYFFKENADTVFFYIDDNYNIEDDIEKTETENIGKFIDIGDMVDMDGLVIKWDDLRGKVVVINFWGTWCAPCVKEIPDLNLLIESYSDKAVVFLAPSVKSEKKEVANFLSHRNFNYQVIPEADELAIKFTNLFPTNIVIDKEGIVRFVKVGTEKAPMNQILSIEINKYL